MRKLLVRGILITILITMTVILGSSGRALADMVVSERGLSTTGWAREINPDSSGSLWITDYNAGEIWQADPASNEFTVFPVGGNPVDARQVDGWLWWADGSTKILGRVSVSDGSFTRWLLPTADSFVGTNVDAQGRFYATDLINAYLFQLDETQSNLCTFEMPGNASLSYVVRDGDNLWLSDYFHSIIFRFTVSNNSLTWWQLPGGSSPNGMAVDAAGNLWYADYSNDVLAKLDPTSDQLATYTIPFETTPYMIAAQWGAIWYTGQVSASLGRLDPIEASHTDTDLTHDTQTLDPTSCVGISPLDSGSLNHTHVARTWENITYTTYVNSDGWHVYQLPPLADPYGITLTGFGYMVDSSRRVLARFPLGNVDLSITNSDGKDIALPGEATSYIIQVYNPISPSISGVTVSDIFPAALTNITWTCSASDDSTCTPSGTGNISDTISMAKNGTVTYQVDATISSSAIGVVQNTATVTAPGGIIDTDLINNEDTDYTALHSTDILCGNDASLVTCYQLDESAGTAYLDSVQNTIYNDGSILGITGYWTSAGKINSALDLDGSSNYGYSPDEASLDIANQITLAAWIKPEHYDASDQYLIKKGYTGSTDGYEIGLSSTVSTWPERVYVRVNQQSRGDVCRVNSSHAYPHDGDTWLHVAATFDGSKIRLYINGVLDDELNAPAGCTSIGTNDLPLTIGAQSNGTIVDGFYQGAIDDVRVYNRELSDAEIAELYDFPTGVDLVDFNAISQSPDIRLSWHSVQETDLIGFNLFRAEALDGSQLKINPQLIPAINPGQLQGNDYHYLDATAEIGKMYYYWAEWVGLGGSQFFGPVTARLVPYSVWLPLGLR